MSKYDDGSFGDYTYSGNVIWVTDSNSCSIQIWENELVSMGIPVDRHKHIKVYYDNQPYWLPKEFYFPQ